MRVEYLYLHEVKQNYFSKPSRSDSGYYMIDFVDLHPTGAFTFTGSLGRPAQIDVGFVRRGGNHPSAAPAWGVDNPKPFCVLLLHTLGLGNLLTAIVGLFFNCQSQRTECQYQCNRCKYEIFKRNTGCKIPQGV